MLGDMQTDVSEARLAEGDAPPMLTLQQHQQRRQAAYARFSEAIAVLRTDGWDNLRVDTLVHPLDADEPMNERYTIRHHYSGGEWDLYYEHPRFVTRRVRIRLGRELPTVGQMMSELYGTRLHLYRPLTGQRRVSGGTGPIALNIDPR